jgi:3-methyladenine DNA glycosylase AlkD
MQAYLRSSMPFLGVAVPETRRRAKAVFSDLTWDGPAPWAEMVLRLWRNAAFREERYATIFLTGVRAARPYQTPAALPVYEEMIVSGAWWDLVDEIAIQRVGPILRAFPGPTARTMRGWARGPDPWLRRAAIICQVGSGPATDRRLLGDCIRPSLDERGFFLRKAIGWALRQFARTDPAWVRSYVAEQGDRLSPLSRREAMKHLGARASALG